jgi:hypothetical protein
VAERILTTFPVYLVRRLAAPAVLGAIAALVATYFMQLLQRTREPALPRMSDDWLRTHDRDAGHSDEWGGFSW